MLFDFHYHLLFKHYIYPKQQLPLGDNLKTGGLAGLLNGLLGGPFDSQSSPKIVGESPLQIGVIALLSVEHAFANRVLHVLGMNLSNQLPIDQQLFADTRDGKTTYYNEFVRQVKFHVDFKKELAKAPYNIVYLNRTDFAGQEAGAIEAVLTTQGKRYMCFSIEGGHNLSNVPIRQRAKSLSPELQLKAIQDASELDFISINLCHLSDIPEQSLGGFAQGVNKMSQLAFSSDDFMPKQGFGLTESGKKVVRQALTHATRPILIDVKHMSIYTRLHYYKFREKLIAEQSDIDRLPIISSHTGFTFTSVTDYVNNKRFQSTLGVDGAQPFSIVKPENRKIGRTNDLINKGLFCNPWTINLFDEDIVAIMESRGLIGISLDQRVLGASNPGLDSIRDKYFEGEYIPNDEWKKLFRDGQRPGAESVEVLESLGAPRTERHIMLLCLHIVYAVRIGYEHVGWGTDESPWDFVCIGSDFDGLINPINGFNNMADLKNLEGELRKYLPEADRYLKTTTLRKAFDYDSRGNIVKESLDKGIQKFLFTNGLQFITRFLSNWKQTGGA